jgi:transposase
VKMAQNNGDFTAKECRAVMKYLFLKGNSAKNIYDDMSVTLGDKRPSYSTVENWVAGFRTGQLSTEDEERSGRPTQTRIPQILAIELEFQSKREGICETRSFRVIQINSGRIFISVAELRRVNCPKGTAEVWERL